MALIFYSIDDDICDLLGETQRNSKPLKNIIFLPFDILTRYSSRVYLNISSKHLFFSVLVTR